jgi:hypothetical protein
LENELDLALEGNLDLDLDLNWFYLSLLVIFCLSYGIIYNFYIFFNPFNTSYSVCFMRCIKSYE